MAPAFPNLVLLGAFPHGRTGAPEHLGYCTESLRLLLSVDFASFGVVVVSFLSLTVANLATLSRLVSRTFPLMPLKVIGAPPVPMRAE